MATPSGYKFPILDSSGAATSTSVDFADMFVTKESLLDAGLYMWGTNSVGYTSPLGLTLGEWDDRSSPVQLGTGTNWKQMAGGGYFTMAIKTDGTLWGWGQNQNGQIGNSKTADQVQTPVQIGTMTNWKQVSTGKIHTMMIKTDGTLWGCGYNGSTSYTATLGTGDKTDRSSPVQVGSLTNWKLVASSGYSNFAIKTDGTLWAMGRNANGELGLGDLSARSSPVQVGTKTWKNIKCSAGSTLNQQTSAIRGDGSLWVWGINNLGQLGLGDINKRSSPTQVGSLTDWKLTATGTYNIYAIKTDGTLWAWGYNTYGQLGLSDITDRSSPVQVGSLTNWKSLSCGAYSVMAHKTDGTIWAWGYNGSSNNQLGTALGTAVGRISSPVQVGSLTNWKSVMAGNGHFGGNLGVDVP